MSNQDVMNELVDQSQEIIRLKDKNRELYKALKDLYGRVSNDSDAKNWFKLEQLNADLALESIKGES